MFRRTTVALAAALAFPTATFAAGTLPAMLPTHSSSLPSASARVADTFRHLPLQFERNDGQTDSRVKFLARTNGSVLYLTGSQSVLALLQTAKNPMRCNNIGSGERSGVQRVAATLRMTAVGANLDAAVVGDGSLPGKVNYFLGDNPAKWQRNVPTYRRVAYRSVYKNTDLVYYGNDSRLEYDFVVHPGGDPRKIALTFTGAKSMSVDALGDLVLLTGAGNVTWRKPMVYQERGGERMPISGRYLAQGGMVHFALSRYDASLPIVIDPVLDYSTFLTGSDGSMGEGIAVDSSDSAYVAGSTSSLNFPTTSAAQSVSGGGTDAFITKFNAAGTALVYSTYVGGSGTDEAYALAIDSAGSAYIAGQTTSSNFPLVNAYQSTGDTNSGKGFVAKLSPSGSSLTYSTYLGGTGGNSIYGIAVDSSDCAYVTGPTSSTNYPTVHAYESTNTASGEAAFVTKLAATGSSLVYSTYLCGSSAEIGKAITVDSSGCAYAVGTSLSTNFPTVNAYQPTKASTNGWNAYLTKFSADGQSLIYSTYLGGSATDVATGVVVDGSNSAYLCGTTDSPNFPTVSPYQSTNHSSSGNNAFVTKFAPSGGSLVYSTYVGGTGSDNATGIAIDINDCAYVTGTTTSSDFPVLNATQTTLKSSAGNAFVTKLAVSGSPLIYSTYLGGSSSETGAGIAVDGYGCAYVTGSTTSTDFPTKNAYQSALQSDEDAYVTKFSPSRALNLLWNHSPDGEISLWTLNGVTPSDMAYNPGSGWTAIAEASGPDGVAHILMDHTSDHELSLWAVNPDYSLTYQAYGPYSGWKAADVTVTPDNHVHVLLNRTDGEVSVWDMASPSSITSVAYAASSGWTAIKLAQGPDNHVHVLLNHSPDNQASVWNMTGVTINSYMAYGPYSGWQASNLAVGPDNQMHILWNHPSDGEFSIWDMTSPTAITNPTYGPYSGWTAQSISVNDDNHVRLQITHNDGEITLWDMVSPTVFTEPTFGPYSGWSVTEVGDH